MRSSPQSSNYSPNFSSLKILACSSFSHFYLQWENKIKTLLFTYSCFSLMNGEIHFDFYLHNEFSIRNFFDLLRCLRWRWEIFMKNYVTRKCCEMYDKNCLKLDCLQSDFFKSLLINGCCDEISTWMSSNLIKMFVDCWLSAVRILSWGVFGCDIDRDTWALQWSFKSQNFLVFSLNSLQSNSKFPFSQQRDTDQK